MGRSRGSLRLPRPLEQTTCCSVPTASRVDNRLLCPHRLKNSTKAKPIGCEMASTLVKLHHIPPGPPPTWSTTVCIYISFLKLTVLLGISCRACPCEGSSVCQ
ncbi:unnamed protein product [Boreogadus saida]